MKVQLALSLVVSIASVAATHRHRSSSSRSVLSFVKENMGNICLEINHLKQTLKECCDQKGWSFAVYIIITWIIDELYNYKCCC